MVQEFLFFLTSPHPQLLAGLVKLSFGSRLAKYEPLMSRRYAFLMLGRFPVELLVDNTTNTVCVKFYLVNAMMLLQQVLRVVHDVLEQRFVSLQYELLTPFEDVFVEVGSDLNSNQSPTLTSVPSP